MKLVVSITATVLLTGCGTTHDLIKDVESKAYDSLAKAFSEYCEGKSRGGLIGPIAKQEALEARREIRQRGKTGPQGPTEKPEYLDDKTAYGQGPVVRIWCDGEPVPPDVWPDFVRVRD